MDTTVQITLVICLTIIICYIISCFKQSNNDNKPKLAANEKDNSRLDEVFGNGRLGYCKSPTYPKPQRPGTSSADALRNINPPDNKRSTDTLEISQEDE